MIPELAIQPYDEVGLTVRATNGTDGTITVTNYSTGQCVSKTFSGSALCLQDAEWIIENASDPGYPPAAFETFSLTDARATLTNGSVVGPTSAGAKVLELESGGEVYTETSPGENSVTVRYTQ